MAKKLFWTISDKQQKEVERFFEINKINGVIEDLVIDNLDLLAKNIEKVYSDMIKNGQITEKEFNEETLPYVGKLPKQSKNMKLKVVVLSGNRILDGVIKSGKINNFLNRKEKKIVFETVDEFVNAYMLNEFAKLSAWLVQYDMKKEVDDSKKLTIDGAYKKSKQKSIDSKFKSSP